MDLRTAIAGPNPYSLSNVVEVINRAANDLLEKLKEAAERAGVDVSGVDSLGDIAKLYSDNGMTNIAGLAAAVAVSEVLIVRELGRYGSSSQGIQEVIDEYMKDFPSKPSPTDLDTLLQEVEQGSASSTTAVHVLVQAVGEEGEEVTEEVEEKEEEGGE